MSNYKSRKQLFTALILLFTVLMLINCSKQKSKNIDETQTISENGFFTKANNSTDNLLVDKGNYYSFGGDMIIPKHPLTQGLIDKLQGNNSNNTSGILKGVTSIGCLFGLGDILKWNDGIIPYAFYDGSIPAITWGDDDDAPMQIGIISDDEKRVIRNAMNEWEKGAKIKFMEVALTSEMITKSYIIIKDYGLGSPGKSTVGWMLFSTFKFNPNRVYVNGSDNPNNPNYNEYISELYGTSLHELGHCLGLWHEHQRYDRDQYIQVDSNYLNDDNYKLIPEEKNITVINIEKDVCVAPYYGCDWDWRHGWHDCGYRCGEYVDIEIEVTFSISLSKTLTPYDYESIMHYGCGAITPINLPAGVTKQAMCAIMGQEDHLSAGDKSAIQQIYGNCDPTPCKNNSCLTYSNGTEHCTDFCD
jgi:hypothetical protein